MNKIILILSSNLAITFWAWFAWNVLKFSFDKDGYDDTGKMFPFKEYKNAHWDNWIASFVMIPILLFVGSKQLGLDALGQIDMKGLKWSDWYYLLSGFITELIKDRYKKWKKKTEV